MLIKGWLRLALRTPPDHALQVALAAEESVGDQGGATPARLVIATEDVAGLPRAFHAGGYAHRLILVRPHEPPGNLHLSLIHI